jgi:hypothetical protein
MLLRTRRPRHRFEKIENRKANEDVHKAALTAEKFLEFE